MHLLAGIDEIGSETQVSEGWTYAIFPKASVMSIDATVSQCATKHFHGKEFEVRQANDYRSLLRAARLELEKSDGALLVFSLLETSWKAKFKGFAERLISGAMRNVGVVDAKAISVAEHLFPGLITIQRLVENLPGKSIEVEIDSDKISEQLGTSVPQVSGCSMPTAKMLKTAYEAYRQEVFPHSPALVDGGLRVLNDANSRSIQIADVFGNFALNYLFVSLGKTSNRRATKAKIFEDVFGDMLDASQVVLATKLVGNNDIQLKKPGGYTLRIGTSVV